jgi:Putative peptidoglycan binding domain
MHMARQWMDLARQLRPAAAGVIFAFALAPQLRADEPDLDRFRANIDAFVHRIGPSSNGVVRWAGSDPHEIRRDGDAFVAVIANPRLSFRSEQLGHLALDRLEIRQIGQKEDSSLVELALLLPNEMTLTEADGTETKIALTDAKANALLEAQSGRGRATNVRIASARIEQPKTGAWTSVGPLSMTSKLIAETNGGWSGPVEFEANNVEYFIPQGPVGGAINRIAFSGNSAGPKLDELDKLREAIESLHNDEGRAPEPRGTAFLAVLPTIAAPFGTIRGQIALTGLTVRSITGEALVSLAKAGSKTEITGLDTEQASIRFSVSHEGLELAPSVLEQTRVPHRVVLDLGIADLSTQAFSKLLQAVAAMAAANEVSEDESQQKKQQATQQALGAVAMFNPTFHVYNIAVETEDLGVDLTAEARGSPFAPKGYTAAGDLVIRGFDAIAKLSAGVFPAEYLPVLKELGIEEKAPDGTPRLDFHLTSAPPKWIKINGNDVSAWFDGAQPDGGQPRWLRPSDPPMEGPDVRSVQRALAGAKIPVGQDGLYDPTTAAAVARFQKQNAINANGVVDTMTRQWLGVGTEAPRR